VVDNGRWLSPQELAARKWFREGLDARPRGGAVSEASEVDKRMKTSTRKRRSERFQVESIHLGEPVLEKVVQLLEQTWANYHDLFGLDEPAAPPPITVVMFRTQQEHDDFIEAFEKGASAADKALSKKNDGAMYTDPPMAECVQRDKPQAFLFDYAIHSVCHIFLAFHTGSERAWLTEGLGTYFTTQIRSTALCACVNLEGTAMEGGKAFSDPANWHEIVRGWVLKGGDPPLAAVLRSSLNELDRNRMVKAWSVIDYLVVEHRDKLKTLAAALVEDPKDPGERAFQKALGMSVAELEAAWKAHVRRSY
jgi:hypothetical protein